LFSEQFPVAPAQSKFLATMNFTLVKKKSPLKRAEWLKKSSIYLFFVLTLRNSSL